PGDVLSDRAPDGDHVPGRNDSLQAHHPGSGDAVLERVRSAGVRRDVAADLRMLGRARIRREEEPTLPGDAPDLGCRKARLDVQAPEKRFEAAGGGKPREGEDAPALERHGACRESGAATSWDDGDIVPVAPGNCGGHLPGWTREGDPG